MRCKGIKPGMGLPCRFLKAAFTGLVAGFLFAFILGRSVWLEMRLNIGHVIPVSVSLAVLIFILRRRPITLFSFLFLELFAVLLVFSLYGFDFSTIIIVPAALFRDGFHLSSLSLRGISIFLLCLLGAANVVWICADAIMRRRGGDSRCSAAD